MKKGEYKIKSLYITDVNKSHATSYSLITIITAYLKKYYPVEFWAALLTIQDDKEKRAKYLELLDAEGITIELPDVNSSVKEFVPVPEENKILFGLASIDGVGEASIDPIIENRPYNTLEELMEKVPKKALDKRVGLSLIKCGALDNISKGLNRYELINKFYEIRKDKDELLNPEEYNNMACMELETSTLGTPITYKPWFNKIEPEEKIEFRADIIKVTEKLDKNGNMMAFVKVESEGCEIELIVFARTYCKNVDVFDVIDGKEIIVKGKKDEKGKVIVSSAKKA